MGVLHQIDQINLTWAVRVALAQLGGDKTRFKPIYAPPGSMWADLGPHTQQAMSAYTEMTQSETVDWLASLPAYRNRLQVGGTKT